MASGDPSKPKPAKPKDGLGSAPRALPGRKAIDLTKASKSLPFEADQDTWKWRLDAVEEALGIEASRRVIYPHTVDGETRAYGRFGGM